MKKKFLLVPIISGLLINTFVKAQTISLSAATYTQDFNALAITGTSSTLPTGWLFSESGTNANALYNTGTGSNNAGDTYSFGASGNTDRAFGGLQSGSLLPIIGAAFTNNTGSAIGSLTISYTGEQWRLGALAREDRLDFQFSINATSLTTGTWTDVNQLDFIAPTKGPTVGALDGNAAANKSSISFTLTGLPIENGATIYIRWIDFNASGADDGLAVDDFSIGVNLADLNPPVINSFFPANGAGNVATNFTARLTFNETVQKATGSIIIKKANDNSIFQTIDVTTSAVTVSATTVSFNLSGLAENTSYYIEISSGAFKDLAENTFAGITGNSVWTFTTSNIVYAADFNGCSSSLTDGFTQYSITGAIIWGCTAFGRDPAAPAGTNPFPSAVQINGFSGGTNVPNIDWLISPSFNLTATTYPLLSFWSRTAFNGLPLQLKVSTDYVSGDPRLATWTDINGKFPFQTSNIWTFSSNINLTAFKQSNVHFAFVYTSTDEDGARWTVDDITLTNSPTPPPPSLTVSTTDIQYTYVASGLTADKIFTFTGNDLTGNVMLNSTGNFMISKDGTSFSSSLTYSVAEANNLTKTVFVRFAPTQNNLNYAGTVTIATPGLSFIINLKATSIDPATTLELVNWNLEWFGSIVNGPSNDNQQEQNVKTILQNIGADIYGLVEVVDESRLAHIVSQMPGYSYVIGNYGSHVNPPDVTGGPLSEAQKLAFVYKTNLLSNISVRPLINNQNILSTSYNNWSSGRYPLLMKADVTLNCVKKTINFILIHAKANTSPTATSYARRQAAANELHDTLMTYYPTDNIILSGDFNDDLDQSITDGFTTTSYSSFTTDNANFFSPTLILSFAGKKSTVSFNDVIDHVMLTNEMQQYYISSTANILTDAASLVNNYGSTTTDHYPVFTRYKFEEPVPLVVNIPDAFAMSSGVLPNTVYFGYASASSITLISNVSGGNTPYSYSWSNGSASSSISVSPAINTTYSLTVTEANGCQATANKTITVMDIRGGKKLDKVIICHKPNKQMNTLEIGSTDVPDHLAHGDMLGSCLAINPSLTNKSSQIEENIPVELAIAAMPNPFTNYFTISINGGNVSEKLSVRVTDILGRTIERKDNLQTNSTLKIGNNYRPGVYIIEVIQGTEHKQLKLIKAGN